MNQASIARVDLHTHTTASDGTYSPTQLVELAAEIGLTAVAITDHDCTFGLAEAQKAGEQLEVEIVPGVEMAAYRKGFGSLHVLGYWFDPSHEELQSELEILRGGRSARNKQMLKRLSELGIELDMGRIEDAAGGQVVGRPHFAKAMLEKKVVSSLNQAFELYLGKGKPAYVERTRLSPERTVELIGNAGGLAVLAHPADSGLIGEQLEHELRVLCEAGLSGIEVLHSNHSPEQSRILSLVAQKFDLAQTGGSDFHGDLKPDVHLGAPEVPLELLEILRQKLSPS